MSDPTRTPIGATLSVDPAWGRTARAWGIFAGIAFAIATAAFVVEATGLLASSPDYTSTAAGQLIDEAKFLAASFAHQQQVLWDFVLRDGLYFFAYLALIPLAIGLREVAGHRRSAPQLAAAFLVVAAIFGCMNAFTTFVQVDYWRNSGWEQVPPAIMVAVGRDVDLMNATRPPGAQLIAVVPPPGLRRPTSCPLASSCNDVDAPSTPISAVGAPSADRLTVKWAGCPPDDPSMVLSRPAAS